MADAASGEKDRLTITACKVDSSGNVSVDDSRQFKFSVNPEKYDHSFSISYNDQAPVGKSEVTTRFDKAEPEVLKIRTLLDCTGALGGEDATTPDVKTQLENLSDIVYSYDGNQHEPNPVQVLWGSQIFIGRLTSLKVDNTLFKASGEPLRAMLDLEFKSYVSSEEESLRANRSSPDMSHTVEVRAGDTLPLLCYRIYRDSSYYIEVARHNNLTEFRDLEPGSKLHFPPLR
jgi:hypothetical protein